MRAKTTSCTCDEGRLPVFNLGGKLIYLLPCTCDLGKGRIEEEKLLNQPNPKG